MSVPCVMVDEMVDGTWGGSARSLYARFQAGEVSSGEMLAEFPQIWRSRPDSDPLDSAEAWRAMVEHAGYFTWKSGQAAGRRARRPVWPRRLFRGATPERRFGMSWTRNPAIAEYFARYRQPPGREVGRVWVGVFAPSRLLAYIKDEREYLVDPVGADIQPLE